jgi:uncharacterized phage protein (TIGR02218 family)
MSFETNEVSIQDGKPLYLLRFVKQGKTWLYTNVDVSVVLSGETYAPLPITISAFGFAGDAKSDGVDITLPYTAAVCQYLDSGAASTGVAVFIRKLHDGDMTTVDGVGVATAVENAPIVWVGELIGTSRPAVNSRVLRCNTLSLSMSRNGLRLSWGRGCPHMLYDSNCRVNKGSYGVRLYRVSVVDGINLSSPSFNVGTVGYFAGGFIEWVVDGVLTERRGIDSHTGTTISIIGGTRGMVGATNFIAYPGCTRTIDICNSRFNNQLNFGGIRYLQGINPFASEPIF